MPLLQNARELIRANLERIRDGKKVKAATIGRLTEKQLVDINSNRAVEQLPPIVAEVVFVGGHIYKSRVVQDGYTIEDVLDQISSAMDGASVAIKTLKMTGIENPNPRADRYGNKVNDRAIFECSTRHPRPELFGVIPKGDVIRPPKQKGPLDESDP